jgi:hypothetical protein
MKTNIVLMWILTAYFFALSAVYTVWSVIDKGAWSGLARWQVLSGALTVL